MKYILSLTTGSTSPRGARRP